MSMRKLEFSLSCNIWTWLLSSSSVGRTITVWWFKKDLWHIFRTYFSPLHLLSLQAFVFPPCSLFSFSLEQQLQILLASVLIPSFNLCLTFTSSHVTAQTRLPHPPCLFNYHFSSLFNLFMLRKSTLYPAWNCQLPSIQLSSSWNQFLFGSSMHCDHFYTVFSTNPSRFYCSTWWRLQNTFYFVSFSPAFKLSQGALTCKFQFNNRLGGTHSPNSPSQTSHPLGFLTFSYEWLSISFSSLAKLKQLSWYSLTFSPLFS